MNPLQTLLIEDDDSHAALIVRHLEGGPGAPSHVRLDRVSDLAAGMKRLESGGVDVVLLDLGLPDSSGIETLLRLVDAHPSAAVIVLTSLDDPETGPVAVHAGAQDYLSKMALSREVLVRSVRYSFERKRAAEEIESRNRQLESLLHIMSHDLREPLRAVSNFSGILRSRYQTKLDAKGLDLLRRIIAGSARMAELLDDILDLARARRSGVASDGVDGAEVVQEALARLGDRIADTNATVSVVGRLPVLPVEKTWAVQVVYNLVCNALKFCRPGGSPEIEIAPFETASGRPREVGVTVRDRGPGVDSGSAERIFRLFQREVGREVDGTGAGLAIVREVAAQYGGRAWVEPRNGGGSEFHVSFGETPSTSPLAPDVPSPLEARSSR